MARPSYAGMATIKSAGKTFFQGSTGSWAAQNEKPTVQNSFTYSFSMDTTEVTQGLYEKIMGYQPVSALSKYGRGPNYPVYFVSWFDAVLFCNARSKQSGFDTVYTYTRIEQSAGGTVYKLSDLVTHFENSGFRLPTEAEWEFASSAGAITDFPWGNIGDSDLTEQFAWFAKNAQGSTHPVGELKRNALGLYDMAGNVMEWVNDWKGPYPKLGSEDFAGLRDPSPEMDTPVKGGAFKFNLRELRTANRSATYPTIHSSTAEYVGFRCVLGPINQPRYSTIDGNQAVTDAVHLTISRLLNLVGGRPAKLVFVNASQIVRHLVYVNYQKSPPQLQEYADIANVFYPTISPNGKWVAFSTALEGSTYGSSLYIRSLDDTVSASIMIGPGYIPRWWVNPVSQDTFLVYTNSAVDNTQGTWNNSLTLIQKMSDGKPEGAPQTLSEGSFHDGRSQDGNWLVTGFRNLKTMDLATHKTRVLFTAPSNGKDPDDTSQVCNVSIAPDSSGHSLFLDFGYEGKSKITGSFYDIHQIAFVADTDGKILRWFSAPNEIVGWDDLEWSNQRDYAVSSSKDKTGGHRHLYLLNLKDSVVTKLATGTQLSTPGLWLGPTTEKIPLAGLELDSLGHYDDPATDIYQTVFAGHMLSFWKRHLNLELIFTGSSHVFCGIDPNQMTKLQSLSMGYPSNGWQGQEEWVTGYALNHCPKLKVIVMEVFPGWLHYSGSDFTWKNQISKSKGVQYDMSQNFWKEGLPFRFEELVSRAPNSTAFAQDTTGFFFQATANWGGPAVVPPESEWGLDNPEYQATMLRIEAMAQMSADRKIHIVLLNFPTNPAFKGNAYYGPYGPRIEVATAILKRIKEMENLSPYIHFYDANNFNEHDYTDAEAFNEGHLSSTGAAKLTKRLDEFVNGFP